MKKTSSNKSNDTKTMRSLSVNSPPGNFGDRVFIGGNYRHGAALQNIKDAVVESGFTPIIVAEFDIQAGTERDSSLTLLRQCKFAIFEVTTHSGYIAELERVVDYQTVTLCLWDSWGTEQPKISAMVTSNPAFQSNNKGYSSTRDMQEKAHQFLLKL